MLFGTRITLRIGVREVGIDNYTRWDCCEKILYIYIYITTYLSFKFLTNQCFSHQRAFSIGNLPILISKRSIKGVECSYPSTHLLSKNQ